MTQTQNKEVTFYLPIGYVDGAGNLYQTCTMRPPTPEDEEIALKEAGGIRDSHEYHLYLLAKVVLRFELQEDISPMVIRNLYATDFDYLIYICELLKQGLPVD